MTLLNRVVQIGQGAVQAPGHLINRGLDKLQDSTYRPSAIHTQFLGFFIEEFFVVSAQVTKGDDVKNCGLDSGKTVEEAEDKAIQRALDHLG